MMNLWKIVNFQSSKKDEYPEFVKKMIELGYKNIEDATNDACALNYYYNPIKKHYITKPFIGKQKITLREYLNSICENLPYFVYSDAREEIIKELLPYESFAELFEFDTSIFTQEKYYNLIPECCPGDDFLEDFAYFNSSIRPYKYDKEKWEAIIERIKNMEIEL